MTVLTTYKTLYGSHEVKVLSPTPSGATAKFLDDNMRAMADAIDDLKDGVTGNPGPAGAPGTDGSDGADGATIRIGTLVSGTDTVTSTETSGKVGDVYVNSSTSALYQCSAAGTSGGNAAYTYVGLFQGPQGETGPAGPTGAAGPTGPAGANGTNGTDGAPGADGADAQWTVSTDNNSTTCSFALANGTWKVFGNSSITSLTVTSSITAGQCSTVEFAAGSSSISYTAPTGCKHYGDACDSDGDFTPAISTRYLLTYLQTAGGTRCFVKTI